MNKDFKKEWIADIIDAKVRNAVQTYYDNNIMEGNKKIAPFTDLKENPIVLFDNTNSPEKPKIVVKRVRLSTNLKTLREIPQGYVPTSNNHHVAIYKNSKGKYYDEATTFWDAVTRKQNGEPVIKQVSENGDPLFVSLQQGETFIFNLTEEQLREAIEQKNNKLIAKNLYVVGGLSSADYSLHRHTIAKREKNDDAKVLQDYIRVKSPNTLIIDLKAIKVRVNHIGKIVAIGEELN